MDIHVHTYMYEYIIADRERFKMAGPVDLNLKPVSPLSTRGGRHYPQVGRNWTERSR